MSILIQTTNGVIMLFEHSAAWGIPTKTAFPTNSMYENLEDGILHLDGWMDGWASPWLPKQGIKEENKTPRGTCRIIRQEVLWEGLTNHKPFLQNRMQKNNHQWEWWQLDSSGPSKMLHWWKWLQQDIKDRRWWWWTLTESLQSGFLSGAVCAASSSTFL